MPDDDAILKEICAINGLNLDTLSEDGAEVEKLEMFFSGYPRMVHLQYFPHLQELKIISQEVSTIENLECCPNLKKLWICECQLKEISHLDQCPELRYLYLYGNHITKIQKLDCLECLECLWLNDNEITTIEGLSSLKILTELNLSGNLISKIGHSLDKNISLEKLYLSGNRITELREITNLMSLVKLKDLAFGEPQYPDNPLCSLFNYATFTLYHLPQLSRLDSFDVSGRRVKEDAETLVMKKKMFYSMRHRTLSSRFDKQRRQVIARRVALMSALRDKLDYLGKCAVDLSGKSRIWQVGKNKQAISNAANVTRTAEVEKALAAVQSRMANVQEEAETVRAEFEYFCSSHIEQDEAWCDHLLQLELTTCGNVQFREGRPNTHAWHKLCCELLTSRFCIVPYSPMAIHGLQVTRVMKVSNRKLQQDFDSLLDSIVDYILQQKSGVPEFDMDMELRKHQDYLFWCPELDEPFSRDQVFLQAVENGFQSLQDSTHKSLRFSNSLNSALRLQNNGRPESELCRNVDFLRRPQRVLVARAVMDVGPHSHHFNLLPYMPCGDLPATASPHPLCQCQSRQKDWILSDSSRVIPEFIIDFAFASSGTLFQSHFQHPSPVFTPTSNSSASTAAAELAELSRQVDAECPMLAGIRNRKESHGDHLSLEVMSMALGNDTSNITELHLAHCGLTSVCSLQNLVALRSLDLSHNALTRVEFLNGVMLLEVASLQFNRIATLQDLQTVVSSLHSLDLQWNSLVHVREEISLLHNFTPNISHLRLQFNPWRKPVDLRLRLIGRLKQLQNLDGQPVSDEERISGLQLASGSRISLSALVEHGRCDVSRPRRLHLGTLAEVLEENSFHRVDRSIGESVWLIMITSLCLNRQSLSKICNLDRLLNLKFASFNGNYLTKIEGLTGCTQLEELGLEDNCISNLGNLGHLVHLRRLYLGKNFLTRLDVNELSPLSSLVTLALNDNYLVSLREVEYCRSLVELYVANNELIDSRDIHGLKQLRNLLILDIHNNPLHTRIEHYRSHIIFQLPDLKVLDGESVTPAQISHARELLGGKLTSDFLMDKLNTDRFYDLRELDLPNQTIRCVQLTPTERFINLRSVNLEHNNLTHFSGLIHLPNLRVLCLNHNEIESIYPRPPPVATGNANKNAKVQAAQLLQQQQQQQPVNQPPVLEHLEVLHLAHNGIKDMRALQLHLLPSLKALFLQGNEIVQVEGLEELHNLRELVLDQNKIKCLTENSFGNNWNLRELHMEENRLRELDYFGKLEKLTRLFLGGNRIQDTNELSKLDPLTSLVELSLIKNGVTRKMMHRVILVYRLPRLLIIDGTEVSLEERERAEFYFTQEQLMNAAAANGANITSNTTGSGVPLAVMGGFNFPGGDFSLPGIVTNGVLSKVPPGGVKMASVNLGSVLMETPGPLVKGTAPILGTGMDTNPTGGRQRLAGGGGGAGGGRAAANAPFATNNKTVFYYDPSGYIEPASRVQPNKKK